jgi:hypothetical protein
MPYLRRARASVRPAMPAPTTEMGFYGMLSVLEMVGISDEYGK